MPPHRDRRHTVSIPLQTGKRIQSTRRPDPIVEQPIRFQFPSNGKAYPKLNRNSFTTSHRWVSIPFKRESVSKGPLGNRLAPFNLEFQFPSNGKAYPKDTFELGVNNNEINVSIPFKRESVSKGGQTRKLPSYANTFQFPFKRESVSKASVTASWLGGQRICFNSLQTGKAYPKILSDVSNDFFS